MAGLPSAIYHSKWATQTAAPKLEPPVQPRRLFHDDAADNIVWNDEPDIEKEPESIVSDDSDGDYTDDVSMDIFNSEDEEVAELANLIAGPPTVTPANDGPEGSVTGNLQCSKQVSMYKS
jgi:hypothetical protein